MLKTIIVDDEKIALQYLEKVVTSSNKVEVIGAYLNGNTALKAIEKHKPALIFLDVNLPGMSGLEIIDAINKKNIESTIVLVTGSEEYAVKAFEIGVTDYVLKPYTEKRIHQIINNMSDIHQANSNKVMLHAFKNLHFTKNGVSIPNVKWRTTKSRELFVYLVHNKEGQVRRDVLVELLWPELEVEKAYDNLYTSVYQIRKVLEDNEIDIEIIGNVNGYQLNFKDTEYDVYTLENLIDQLEEMLEEGNDIHKIINIYKKVLSLYKGHYLDEEAYIWTENLKEQYRIVFFSVSQRVIDFLRRKGKSVETVLFSLHLQKIYPYHEYSYFTLMQLYSNLGDLPSVRNQYHLLVEMLAEEFDMQPSPEIQGWYEEWATNRKANTASRLNT